MQDKYMTKKQLLDELAAMRQRVAELEKSEIEPKRAEKKYQTIISTAMDGFWIADMQGNFLDVNDAYCRLIGYSRDELLKMRISDIEAVEKTEETVQRIRKIAEVGGDRFETRHRCKDSRIVDVEVSVNYMTEIDRMFVFLHDITGRKRMEDVLRKNEEEARRLARENAIFAEVGRIISSTLNIEAVYERFAEEVRKLIPFDRMGISIIDYENKTLYVPYFAGLELPGLKPGYTLPLAGSSAEKVIQARSSLLVSEKNREEVLAQNPVLSPYFKAGFQSIMSIPLFSKNQVIGILYFFCTKPDFYTETVRKLAEGISTQIAGAIANAQLFNKLNRVMRELGESEERYRNILANIEDGYFEVDLAGNFTFFNESLCKQLGYSKEEMIGMNNRLYMDKETSKDIYRVFNRVYTTKEPYKAYNWKVTRKDGAKRVHEGSISLMKDAKGEPIGFRGINRDITERIQVEDALRQSEEEARHLAEENAVMAEISRIISSTLNIEDVYEGVVQEVGKLIQFDRVSINVIDPVNHNSGVVRYAYGIEVENRMVGKVISLAGTASNDAIRNRISLLIQGESQEAVINRWPALLHLIKAGVQSFMVVPLFSKNEVIGALNIQSMKEDAYTEMDLKKAERVGNQIAGAIANALLFEAHIRAEEEKNVLHEQLRQSQKMEAIGQLAGGVAHDFNNHLTIIRSHSQLALRQLKEGDRFREIFRTIEEATTRSANLVRQILAFSRRQVMEMIVIDLNDLFRGLEKMLRRIIGEDVALRIVLADDLGRVKADPGQIEQVIFNLAVNSRDAMPSGGKLTIETSNVALDEAYARRHVSVTPGRYVMIAVSDTGKGMPPEVRDRIFEPFFTTKEIGKGTGLGLSTVYGIVKQSGGNIWVYSEPGKGTSFKIYLPRVDDPLTKVGEKEESELFRGVGVILVVEDDKDVREVVLEVLRTQGYSILEALNEEEALLICQQYKDTIHLMLTDVVMPQISGFDLAKRLVVLHPEMKVLFMSGYADNAIIQHGVFKKGLNFIQKPFSINELTRKVREVLEKDRKLAI
jgi:PAS domain S-box-containing protein